MSVRKAVLLALLSAALAYLPVLRAEFVWDDQMVRRGIIPASKGLLSPFDARTNAGTWIYRPVTTLSLLLEEALNRRFIDSGLQGETDPATPARARIPHAFSLLLHVLAAGAVTLLAAEMLHGRRECAFGAAVAGLVFALHPIHVESVAWVSARADLLSALFFVTSLLLLFQARRRDSTIATAAAAGVFLLAVMSKENAIAGVLLVPLALRSHPERSVAATPLVKPLALYGAMLALYLALRWAGGGTVGFNRPPDLVLAAAQTFAAAGYYLRKILVPWPLLPLQVALPGAALSLVSLGGALAAGALAVARYRRGDRLYLLCLVWFVVTCLPVLPLALQKYAIAGVAERFLYLPSVGFAVAGGAGAAALAVAGRRRAAGFALAVLLAAYGATVWWSAATVWKDNVTFLSALTRERDYARQPTLWVTLGYAYRDRKDPAEAERNFLRALGAEIVPSPQLQAEAWYGLGELRQAEAERHLASGQVAEAASSYREAEQSFTRAVAGDPGRSHFLAGRALIRLQLLLIDEAGGAPRPEAGLLAAGQDIAELARLAPEDPGLAVLRGIYRTLGGVEIL